jgi:tetratricopeptide (TPR) repeat protein
MVAVLCLANVLAWRSALDGPFVLDDRVHIVEDEARLADPLPLAASLRHEQRPLTFLSLAANHAWGGIEPRGYRATNVLLHLATALLLLATIRSCGRRIAQGSPAAAPPIDPSTACRIDWTAFAAALLWSLHPLTTAAIAQVVQRAEILASMGTIAAAWMLLASLRGGRRRWWALGMPIAVAFALLSKPTAIATPPLLLLLDWTLSGDRPATLLRRRGVAHLANFLLLLLLLPLGVVEGLFATDAGPKGAGLGVAGTTPLQYALLQVRALGLYLELTFWPAALSIDHGTAALASPRLALVGGLAWTGLAVAAIAGGWRRRWWGALAAGVILLLAPTSTFVPLADPVAEQRFYLPLALLAAAAAAAGTAIAAAAVRRRHGGVAVAAMIVLLAAVAVAEGRATTLRNRTMTDPVRVWSEVLERRPDHERALLNRSQALIDAGRIDEAQLDLQRLAAIDPGDPWTQLNLAIVDLERDRPEAALSRLDRALRQLPQVAAVRAARGDALRALGRETEAVVEFQAAMELRPAEPLLPLAIANILADLGDDEASIAWLERAESLALRGHRSALAASARFNIGNAHFRQGRHADALASYEAALRIDPAHPGAIEWRGEAARRREAPDG